MNASRSRTWRVLQRQARAAAGLGQGRFLAMIAVATVAIYALMFLTVVDPTHVEFSQIRLWRALAMGAAVALIVLAFLPSGYRRPAASAGMFVGTVMVLGVSLWMIRSQRTIDDVAYLKAMIPHHSMSVLTSTRARIRDERVRELADEILESRLREIEKMKELISELDASPPESSAPVLRPPARALLTRAPEGPERT
jgi:hypothetical protein